MSNRVQVKLPPEMTPIVNEIKAIRLQKCEPTSYKSIIIDALKNMHDQITKTSGGTDGVEA